MNILLEKVYRVCDSVRKLNCDAITFKKLLASTRVEFKKHDICLDLKSKKDKTLIENQFCVEAYYDADNDLNNEIPIEVIIYHNFDNNDKFYQHQITELLIQIYDATVHELRHQIQSRRRGFETFSSHSEEPYSSYLADPDEIDAYALSISIELLRTMPVDRAKRYMTRMSVLSKFKIRNTLVSATLMAYNVYFKKNPILKKLAKKVYKHLESIDTQYIFM